MPLCSQASLALSRRFTRSRHSLRYLNVLGTPLGPIKWNSRLIVGANLQQCWRRDKLQRKRHLRPHKITPRLSLGHAALGWQRHWKSGGCHTGSRSVQISANLAGYRTTFKRPSMLCTTVVTLPVGAWVLITTRLSPWLLLSQGLPISAAEVLILLLISLR